MTQRYELCVLRGGIQSGHLVAELTGIRFREEDFPSFSRALERLFSFRAFGLVQPSRIAALDPAVLVSLSSDRDTSLGGVELKDSFTALKVNWESYLELKDMALFPLMRRTVVSSKPTRYEWLAQPDHVFSTWVESARASLDRNLSSGAFSDRLTKETEMATREWIRSMGNASFSGRGKDEEY